MPTLCEFQTTGDSHVKFSGRVVFQTPVPAEAHNFCGTTGSNTRPPDRHERLCELPSAVRQPGNISRGDLITPIDSAPCFAPVETFFDITSSQFGL